MLKGTAIELTIDFYHNEIIAHFHNALKYVDPADVPEFVRGNKALPLPDSFLSDLKGLEDYLEKIDPARIFGWIVEANPEVARAIMDMEDEGATYIVNFKSFIIDSLKASRPEQEEAIEGKAATEAAEEIPGSSMKRLTCDECGESWVAPEEEASATTKCPFCEAPAGS